MEDKNLLESLIADNDETKNYNDFKINELIRKEYPQDRVEAIINNYLSDMSNSKYKAEFDALQEYRKYCKSLIKNN